MTVRTKIICTIGPSVDSREKIIELIQAGMNVARLNFSHGTHEEHLRVINLLKSARQQMQSPLAIMLDTKGPEIRLGKIKNHEITLKPGQKWLLVKEQIEGDETKISINPEFILDCLHVGSKVFFDDGYISSSVIENKPEGVVVQVHNGGKIRSGKGVNIPDVNFDLPSLTEKDIEDIRFGCQQDVDIIAASFVRTADDIVAIKKLVALEDKKDMMIIAKIENKEGVQNFDSIIQMADGIMIARGDLGVQVPLSEVPRLQKMMIRKSYLIGKPSVTATQMLESMINNPRPTRAEVSDVANAIYDSTSSVMLSGETAIGKYPIETVNMMRSIILAAEGDFDYRDFFSQHAPLIYHDVPSSLTLAAVKTAYSSRASAIFAFTSSGTTARLLSRLRPDIPILAMTSNQKCYHQLAFSWGVIPYLSPQCKKITEAFDTISTFALDQKIVRYGDLVIVTAGSPFGISGTTNMMVVESIGDVLVRGFKGVGGSVHGNIIMVLSPESIMPYSIRNQIIVIHRCDESYVPLMKESAGIILHNHIDDIESEKFALARAEQINKSIIVRADGASQILKEGGLVTMDPEHALVYKGVVLEDSL